MYENEHELRKIIPDPYYRVIFMLQIESLVKKCLKNTFDDQIIVIIIDFSRKAENFSEYINISLNVEKGGRVVKLLKNWGCQDLLGTPQSLYGLLRVCLCIQCRTYDNMLKKDLKVEKRFVYQWDDINR
eukprot:UN05193